MFDRAKRTSGRRNQARRARWFALHPLCVHCERNGVVRAAEELDHIIPLSKGGAENDELNFCGLCPPCHRAKTANDLGYTQRGGDINGEPTGAGHWWFSS